MKLCGKEKGPRKKTPNGTTVLRCVHPQGHEPMKCRMVWHIIGYDPTKKVVDDE